MSRRRKRVFFVVFLVVGIGAATTLALVAFRRNMMYFYSPSQVATGRAAGVSQFRLGGLVEKGSVKHSNDGLDTTFVLTDRAHNVAVTYRGILPDLFREGQGIVAHGHIGPGGVFIADQVLAKHDANYMPPNVRDALRQAGKSSARPATASTRVAASGESR